MSLRDARRQVIEEGRRFDSDARVAIGGDDGGLFRLARLLRHSEARAQRFGERGDCGGNDSREQRRALAAAENEKVDRAVPGRRGEGRAGGVAHGVAHRIADLDAQRPQPVRRLFQHREAMRQKRRTPDRHPVCATEDAVLLMNAVRNLQHRRRAHRRKAWIAAKADDGGGLPLSKVPHHLHQAAGERDRRRRLGDRSAYGGTGRRDENLFIGRKLRRIAVAARIGDEKDAVVAALQLLGERLCGKHVPARAARRERDQGRPAHGITSLRRSESDWRRVRARISPTVSAAAISDEPP